MVGKVLQFPASRAGSCSGKSIKELLWEQLMDVYRQLVTEQFGQDEDDQEVVEAELRGQALGLATALAIMMNPYDPQVDAIRAEAEERWFASEKESGPEGA